MVWKHRYSVLSILFGTYLLCYVDRMVMATAIPFIAVDLELSPREMGGVISAFFAGYSLMQIPGGLLADRFGPRTVITVTILCWSVMTALSGAVSSLALLLMIRFLFGLGEGPYPAASSKALAVWFPVRELGRANGVMLASAAIGAAVAPLIVTSAITTYGWRAIFYSLFVPGLMASILVWRYMASSPALSPHVKPHELADYADTSASNAPVGNALLEAIRTPAILWCAATVLFTFTMSWGVLSWLPTYLLKARKFDLHTMGVLTAVTTLAFSLSFPVGGYICDRFFKSRLKVQILIGLIGSATMTALAASASTGGWAVFYFVLTFLFMGIGNSAALTLPLIAAPKSAVGGAFGLVNTAAQAAGVISPLIVGEVLERTGGNFETVLYTLVGICLLGILPASRIRQRVEP